MCDSESLIDGLRGCGFRGKDELAPSPDTFHPSIRPCEPRRLHEALILFFTSAPSPPEARDSHSSSRWSLPERPLLPSTKRQRVSIKTRGTDAARPPRPGRMFALTILTAGARLPLRTSRLLGLGGRACALLKLGSRNDIASFASVVPRTLFRLGV